MLDHWSTSASHSQSTTLVRAAWDKVHSFGLFPRSRYTTSWEGLTFKQAIHMPLPPYLSPLPVIFRMLAYAVITPFVLLLFLDVGGYIVWRIYEGVSLTGTRTAFYKFRTSPVFTRSRTGSPVLSKSASKPLGPSPPRSPETRETSISPISSSASLHDETYGMNSDGELELLNSSSSSSSPGDYTRALPNDNNMNTGAGTSLSHDTSSNIDASIRRRTIHRHSASGSNKRFSVGSDNEEDEDSRREREHTPTLTSLTSSAPPHLTRSNSLGLGFGSNTSNSSTLEQSVPNSNIQKPAMYIASSTSTSSNPANIFTAQTLTSNDDLVKVEKSPAGSIASSSGLEEDDLIFDEAKEIN